MNFQVNEYTVNVTSSIKNCYTLRVYKDPENPSFMGAQRNIGERLQKFINKSATNVTRQSTAAGLTLTQLVSKHLRR